MNETGNAADGSFSLRLDAKLFRQRAPSLLIVADELPGA